MRIFTSYRELTAALALPADAPGAFRFCGAHQEKGKWVSDAPGHPFTGWQCESCGAVKMFADKWDVGTGYGILRKENTEYMHCYACCTAEDKRQLLDRTKPFCAYVSCDGETLSNWPGDPLGKIHSYSESRAGWHGGTIARFHVRDCHGQWWQGRGAGKGMACTLRPMKEPAYAASWGLKSFALRWAPTGQALGVVRARTASEAIRKAPKPYRRYLGEIGAEIQH